MSESSTQSPDQLRTHRCGELRESHIGETVAVCGWVSTMREHAGTTFVVLRDYYGYLQVVVDDKDLLEPVKKEAVIRVAGPVRKRLPGAERPDEPTGMIEVDAQSVELLGPCKTLPFEVAPGGPEVNSELRLQYRYLDLRRREMLENLQARHKVVQSVRASLDAMDFIEVEPPMFVQPTPEGSRDFIVPSRLYPGCGYALPQSPQLYKQMLMVAGIDRYYSFPRCFRDEDPRRGRQLVHTQIDFELAFAQEEDIYEVVETFLCKAFKEVAGIELPEKFPRMGYQEAIDRFGLDKPDLRYGMEIQDVTEIAKEAKFPVFQKVTEEGSGKVVRGIVVPGCAGYTRKDRDELEKYARTYRVAGLAWIAWGEEAIKSAFDRFEDDETLTRRMAEAAGAKPGDLVLMVADTVERAGRALGELRTMLAERLGMIPKGVYKPLWVTDFPMFEFDEETNRWNTMHHMFTQPKSEYLDDFEQRPAEVKAHLYDVVLNGVELGSGSIRINRPELQRRVMDFIGYERELAEQNFGFFLRAYEYGAPPHAGMALGLDNLVMTMMGLTNIQDVIAFPNNSSGMFPLDGAPSPLSPDTLKECHISVRKKPEKKEG